jgi:hypothetical protein
MTQLRVGSLVYATEQGLGYLAKAFVDHGVVTHPIIVEHAHHTTHYDWYPGRMSVPIRHIMREPYHSMIRRELSNCDVFLAFETPFDWTLFRYLRNRQKSIRSYLVTMYECTPKVIPEEPDVYLCPSELDLYHFPHDKSRRIRIPVEVPWRQRTEAKVFVHNAGHGSFRDRNGSQKIGEAIRLVKSDAKFIIRSQSFGIPSNIPVGIEERRGTVDYATLWDEGDVFLFPESFNGLSLPLQEARAAGMLVMATDRFPMNLWLPTEPLIKPFGYQYASISAAYREFDEAQIDPKDIAAKIDLWYGQDVSEYSRSGLLWAQANSWEKLKPGIMEELQR